ncbi:MAG: hypothetical protein ACI9Z3_002226, partial [Roseivirga sp.]
NLTAKLHTSQNILVHKISYNSSDKYISDTFVKNVLHSYAAIQG